MPWVANYVELALRSPLPAMTLVTKAPDAAASGWEPAAGQERLQVEGDLDSRFEVFTAGATAEPARHLLSPEVQAALIAVAEWCDIEVVGDRLYVIARRHLPMAEPAYWEWADDLATLVARVEARGRAEEVAGSALADPARRTRRESLFAAPKGGRAAAGCLVPLLVGLAAAALITKIAA